MPFIGKVSFVEMYKVLLSVIPFTVMFAAHFVSANLYSTICTPLSLHGLLMSLITTSSPVCNGLLSIVSYTSNTYNLIVGGFIVFIAGAATSFAKIT